MIRYNDTDEFNSIETGHTVYISGLPGKSYSYINNKYGVVKDIFITCHNQVISYVAKVEIDSEFFFVNFDYIFRVGHKLNDYDIKNLIFEEEPFNYYISKKELIYTQPIFDENNQIMGVSSDINDRKYVFLYSGIN
jgi:hypothetical protein